MEMLFEYRSKVEVGNLQRDGDRAFIVVDTPWSLGMSLSLKYMEEVLKVQCGWATGRWGTEGVWLEMDSVRNYRLVIFLILNMVKCDWKILHMRLAYPTSLLERVIKERIETRSSNMSSWKDWARNRVVWTSVATWMEWNAGKMVCLEYRNMWESHTNVMCFK